MGAAPWRYALSLGQCSLWLLACRVDIRSRVAHGGRFCAWDAMAVVCAVSPCALAFVCVVHMKAMAGVPRWCAVCGSVHISEQGLIGGIGGGGWGLMKPKEGMGRRLTLILEKGQCSARQKVHQSYQWHCKCGSGPLMQCPA